jgi:endo-1,4-beta-xylanase
MENHITNVAGRWKGKMYHWDVCNELFEENGNHRTWVMSQVIGGGSFPHMAFRKTADVDPAAKLYINDYNIEYSGAKSTAVINLVKDMKSKGVRVDGIGSQCHMIVGQFPSSFQSNLAAQAAAAGEVAITELDIRTNTPASSAKLQQQKTDYQSVFAACLATNGCVGVSIWGVSDNRSWIPQVFSGEGDALPWNSSYQKKPAYDGIVAAINAASGGVTTTRTTTQNQVTTTQGSCVSSTVTVQQTVTRTNTVTVTQGGGNPITTTTTRTTTTAGGDTGNCAAKFAQCGGQGWSGPTCCQSSTCTVSNQWYSQCL